MNFFPLIYQGILLVFFLTFSMGPAFFALLNISLTLSKNRSRMFAMGIIFSDFIICMLGIMVIHYGLEQWLIHFKYKKFVGIISGCVLVLLGGMTLKNVPSLQSQKSRMLYFNSFTYRALFLKGFFLNFFNPTVWLMWLGNITIAGNILNLSLWKTVSYFFLILMASFTVENIKIYLASKIKSIISPLFLKVLNFITGLALIVFGMYLIYSFYFETESVGKVL
jgi:threonine/homoserine/homoserine lactone efflux protein